MHKIYKTFSILFLITILLKLLDVIKNLIIVSKLGVSDNADIYLALISLPEGIIILLGFDTIRGVANSEYSSMDSDETSNKLLESFQNLFKILLIISPILFLILYSIREQLISFFLPGFNSEKLLMSFRLSDYIFPILVFKIIAGFLVSVNNATKRFYFPVLVSSVISICVIISIYIKYFNNELIYNLSIAALIGNFIYTILLIIGSRKFFKNIKWFELKLDQLTKRIIKSCFSIIILVAFNQLYLFSRNYFVSYFPNGAISSINYAGTLPGFINMLIFSTIFSATLSHLSGLFHKGENDEAKSLFWNTILRLFFLVIPIIIVFIAGKNEILSILYLRGSFTIEDLSKVNIPFVWESLSILSVVLSLMSTALFLARKKYLDLTLIGSSVFIIGIFLNYFTSQSIGYYGVCISGLITTSMLAAILILKTKNLWNHPWEHLKKLFFLLLSGLITYLIISLSDILIHLTIINGLGVIVSVIFKIILVLFVYLIITNLLNVSFLKDIKYIIKGSDK